MGTNNRLMFNDISFGKPNPDCDNLACKGYVDVCEKRIYESGFARIYVSNNGYVDDFFFV